MIALLCCLLLQTAELHGVVTRVVDGDTVIVRLESGIEERVRLAAIDAPEINRRNPDPRGLAAAEFVRRACEGREVVLLPPPDRATFPRDRYARLLARVTLQGADLGAILWALNLVDFFQISASRPLTQSTEWTKLEEWTTATGGYDEQQIRSVRSLRRPQWRLGSLYLEPVGRAVSGIPDSPRPTSDGNVGAVRASAGPIGPVLSLQKPEARPRPGSATLQRLPGRGVTAVIVGNERLRHPSDTTAVRHYRLAVHPDTLIWTLVDESGTHRSVDQAWVAQQAVRLLLDDGATWQSFGVAKSTVYAWRNGERRPSAAARQAIARLAIEAYRSEQ